MNTPITIPCQHVWREISNFIEGEIDAELRDRIAAHLKECRHCSAVYDGTTNILRLVANDAVLEIPKDLSDRLYVRLKATLG